MSIALDLVVPVNQQIPVDLTLPVKQIVPVDIPIINTELHQPYAGLQDAGLQDVVSPFEKFLDGLPDSWAGLFCIPFKGWLCTP